MQSAEAGRPRPQSGMMWQCMPRVPILILQIGRSWNIHPRTPIMVEKLACLSHCPQRTRITGRPYRSKPTGLLLFLLASWKPSQERKTKDSIRPLLFACSASEAGTNTDWILIKRKPLLKNPLIHTLPKKQRLSSILVAAGRSEAALSHPGTAEVWQQSHISFPVKQSALAPHQPVS